MIVVTEARALPHYRVWVKFSDGACGEIDLAELIRGDKRPIAQALGNAALFAALRVELDTIVWPNGFDLAPEFLRARLSG